MNGLINLNKPPMISSAQAVSKVKRILGEKTVGHMGTLDPMAEGVLVIGVGKSARLFDYLSGGKKTYIAVFKFGEETDTLDRLGTVINTTNDIPSVDAVLNAMKSLVGEIDQIPPAYSAKHVNGKRAYDLARSGESVDLAPTHVHIYGTELICQPRMNEMVFEISCSSGTYIRSICRDVAKMCGSLATLNYLQRTASGVFNIENSVTLEALEVRKHTAIIPPQDVIDLPRYDVPAEYFEDLRHGRKIQADIVGNVKVYGNGIFFGIGCSKQNILKIKTYLRDE